MSEGFHRDGALIVCGRCEEEIEGCDGLFGDWLHVATRSEFCFAGREDLAEPETAAKMQNRKFERRRRGKVRP